MGRICKSGVLVLLASATLGIAGPSEKNLRPYDFITEAVREYSSLACTQAIPGLSIQKFKPTIEDSKNLENFLDQEISKIRGSDVGHRFPFEGGPWVEDTEKLAVALNRLLRDKSKLQRTELFSSDEGAEKICGSSGKWMNASEAASCLWGPTPGKLMLLLLLQYGYNTSPETGFTYQSPKGARAIPFTLDQLLEVWISLRLLPEFLQKTHLDRDDCPFLRLNLNKKESGGVVATGKIAIFDYLYEFPEDIRVGYLFHEVAHHLCRLIDETSAWQEKAGWDRPGFLSKPTKPYQTYITHYGMENSKEDCAESVTAYRFAPEELKARNLGKYELIRDSIFKGQEFIRGGSCRPGNSVK